MKPIDSTVPENVGIHFYEGHSLICYYDIFYIILFPKVVPAEGLGGITVFDNCDEESRGVFCGLGRLTQMRIYLVPTDYVDIQNYVPSICSYSSTVHTVGALRNCLNYYRDFPSFSGRRIPNTKAVSLRGLRRIGTKTTKGNTMDIISVSLSAMEVSRDVDVFFLVVEAYVFTIVSVDGGLRKRRFRFSVVDGSFKDGRVVLD